MFVGRTGLAIKSLGFGLQVSAFGSGFQDSEEAVEYLRWCGASPPSRFGRSTYEEMGREISPPTPHGRRQQYRSLVSRGQGES